MTFTQSIETCFRKYVTFKGRASRSEFWWFFLFLALLHTAGFMFANFTLAIDGSPIIKTILSYFPALWGVVFLAMLLPLVSASVRRLHDTGRSAWWAFGWLLPLLANLLPPFPPILIIRAVVSVAWLFLFTLKGDADENKYGAPLQPAWTGCQTQ